MKVKQVKFEDFLHLHPSVILFRSLELKTLYDEVKDYTFTGPSLDLGCGHGEISQMVFDGKFKYGLDNGQIDEYKQAIEKEIYGEFLLESAEEMSLSDESVNFVFSNSVIEHIPGNKKVLSEVSRVLKPGGYFLFTVPCANFSKNLYLRNVLFWPFSRFYTWYRNKMLNHHHLYNIEEWTRRLNEVGLKVEKYKYYTSKKALMFWDKMALFVFISKIFGKKDAEKKSREKNIEMVRDFYENDIVNDESGSCLLVLARK